MKNKLFLLFLLSMLTFTNVFGQHTNFNSQRNWSLNKKEFFFGVGATNFLGDLGGRNRIGTDYSPVDFDIDATSLGGMLGYRFRFSPKWATSTQISGGLVRGSDANTQEVIRKSRNLSFRSPIASVSQRIEFILFAKEQFGARYKIPGINGMKDKNTQGYVFIGIGATYFNPQANLNGTWVNLRPLHTEGQGLVGGPEQYGMVTAIVPMGVGVRVGLDKLWRIGFELTYTKTFSDYIDDVSTTYYDKSAIAAAYGNEAAYLSNPSYQNQYWFAGGQQRGDKQKDSYLNFNLVFYRNLTYKPTNYKFGRTPKFRSAGRYKF
ncbi:MAG: hypothetical protein WC044_04030 [Crocinitomicaceae bacterium]